MIDYWDYLKAIFSVVESASNEDVGAAIRAVCASANAEDEEGERYSTKLIKGLSESQNILFAALLALGDC